DDAYPLVQAEREVLALDHAVDQVVAGLEAVEAGPAAAIAAPERLRQLPGSEVGAAQVAYLPLAHQVIQGRQRLIEGRAHIPGVDLVEVDVVGLEPAKARLHLLQDRESRQALLVRSVPHAAAHLRREHHAVADALEGLAHDLLAATAAVDVGGVQKVDARV